MYVTEMWMKDAHWPRRQAKHAEKLLKLQLVKLVQFLHSGMIIHVFFHGFVIWSFGTES